MAYRNKTYGCFDGDTDIHYYRLMATWKNNDGIDFNFNDAHDLNNALDSGSEETIKQKLSEWFANSNAFVVLIGDKTRYLTKFVKWEMEVALKMGLPIIGVNLNGLRSRDSEKCPSAIKDELVIYTSFNAKIIQHALDNWPDSHDEYKKEGKQGPYYYTDTVYTNLGL